MKKRTLACLLAGILAVGSLAGCGKKEEQTSGAKTESGYAKNAKLKVWGSQEDQEMYKKMIEEFQKENPEAADWEIELAVVMGADAKTELLKDASAAADVFDFASDQVMELQAANALYRITKNKDEIIANNLDTAIQSASVDGELYGYPVASTTSPWILTMDGIIPVSFRQQAADYSEKTEQIRNPVTLTAKRDY